jgi:ketosteroid isomerase-like protein
MSMPDKGRITQSGRPVGLFIDQEGVTVWVKTWAQIVRDCEARLHFTAEKLQVEVSGEEIESRIAQLKSSTLKTAGKGQADPAETRAAWPLWGRAWRRAR